MRAAGRRGWTRIELIVVVVVVLTATGLAVVFVQHSREPSHRVECQMHLERIGKAVHLFHGSRKTLPASCIAPGYATWAVQVAPFLEQDHGKALKAWDTSLPYYAQSAAVREGQVWVYYCPARRYPPQLSVSGDVPPGGQGNVPGALGDFGCAPASRDGLKTWMTPEADGALIIGDVLKKEGDRIPLWKGRTTLASLKRGLQYTILIGEKHVPEGQFGLASAGDGSLYNGEHPASFARIVDADHPLAKALNDPYRTNFGSWHAGICHFLMADTSVRPVSTGVKVEVLQDLIRRDLPPEQ